MWFALFSITFYIISILLIVPMLLKKQTDNDDTTPIFKNQKTFFFLTALSAVGLHIINTIPLLQHLSTGQTFTLMEIASLMSVIIAVLSTLAILRVNTMWFLLPIIYAFAIINLIFATFIPSHIILLLNQNSSMLFHIGLSIFAYSVCFIAMLYAIQFAWIDCNLKHKKIMLSARIPPLMTVERHFFRLFFSGELLLTLTLLSGTYHLSQSMSAENLHKAIFSLIGWIIFGIALVGHWKYNWQGKKMIIYSISGMISLTVAYFGSRIII
ncbi:inner membrane protein YpjD [Rodentibacter caecimuris]|uniref:ABC transporter permease n=1 Tax=Rodentibacter caecimuris TaxID=1796644 RepID=A0ABX3KYM5_9PAST|nr:ABC transporter permease [Rodentibacter heylii]